VLALGSAALAGTGAALVVVVMMLVGMVMMVMIMMVFVVMMLMHRMVPPLSFLHYYIEKGASCQSIYFCPDIPGEGLRQKGKPCIMSVYMRRKEAEDMSEFKSYVQQHMHQHAEGIAHSHGHIHENQKAVVNRLARAIGHLEKVKRMVEEGYDCSEVLVQLAAVRSALDNTGKVILKDHMRHCIVDAVAAGDEDSIDDLCQAIDKFMK